MERVNRIVSLVLSCVVVGVISGATWYAVGYRNGARLPTSAERTLSETWQQSSDTTDRLIKTLEEYLQCKEQTP